MEPELTDKAKGGGWFRIANPVAERIDEIGTTAFAVYACLARFVDEAGECYPGKRRLAEMIGKDKRTVDRAICRLESFGLVIKTSRSSQKGQRSNLYILPPP